jgi:hypothetical protein
MAGLWNGNLQCGIDVSETHGLDETQVAIDLMRFIRRAPQLCR